MPQRVEARSGSAGTERIGLNILCAIRCCHFLDEMLQSLIPAISLQLKENFHLSFPQIGLITQIDQMSAPLLQPAMGIHTVFPPDPGQKGQA